MYDFMRLNEGISVNSAKSSILFYKIEDIDLWIQGLGADGAKFRSCVFGGGPTQDAY